MYALAVTPLICAMSTPNAEKVWFSNDATAGGHLDKLRTWWHQLLHCCQRGPHQQQHSHRVPENPPQFRPPETLNHVSLQWQIIRTPPKMTRTGGCRSCHYRGPDQMMLTVYISLLLLLLISFLLLIYYYDN